ncbi:glycosyltransferase [Thalassotalea sediminis]|uniref:glycosyltransferase n=1 Tax=Thalassotalea sediminis TaxID=1759089 RepID=UPI0025726E3F|nr:glycosyltransferase [Thalassotalea sediminis]
MSPTDNIKTLPLVSVYMPTKNRVELLSRAIESVLAQTYPNIELHIVNDGSTDGTYQYLQSLADEHDNIFVYHHGESKGACAARNFAIKQANGEFVTGLDDDDLYLPNRIQTLVDVYDDKYAFVCTGMWWDYGKRKRLIDNKEKVITLYEQLSYNEATSQILVKTERVLAVGGFDESFVACQDYDLWTRLMVKYGDAFRKGDATYIVNDTAATERMIGNPKSVQGYHQFMAKHKTLMNNKNIKNQEFMVLRRQRKPMPLTMLLTQLFAGHFKAKVRYFLSSNFSSVKRLHQTIFKG